MKKLELLNITNINGELISGGYQMIEDKINQLCDWINQHDTDTNLSGRKLNRDKFSNGLVCPECLKEHCEHCKCNECDTLTEREEKEELHTTHEHKLTIDAWCEICGEYCNSTPKKDTEVEDATARCVCGAFFIDKHNSCKLCKGLKYGDTPKKENSELERELENIFNSGILNEHNPYGTTLTVKKHNQRLRKIFLDIINLLAKKGVI